MPSTPKRLSAFAIYSRSSLDNATDTSTFADDAPKTTIKRAKMKLVTRQIKKKSPNVTTTKRVSKRKKTGVKTRVVTAKSETESDEENELVIDDVETTSMTNDTETQTMNGQSTSDEDSEVILAGNRNENVRFLSRGVTHSKKLVVPKAFPCGNKSAEDIFNWLINPLSANYFFNEVYEQCPYHVQRSNPTYYDGVFSVKDFTTIMKENRLNYDKQIDLVAYVDGKRISLDGTLVVYPDFVWGAYEDGYSVRMRNPQAYHKNLWRMCSLLQEYFSSSVGANMYLTPADSQGFPPHYDDIDAFILQIEGKKYWKVYSPTCEEETLPRFSSGDLEEDKIGDPCMEIELEAGDLLYIPRGFIHQACATDEHSLHITISTNQLNTWGDLLKNGLPKALDEAIENNVELRKSLPKDYYEHVGLVFAPDISEVESPERLAFQRKYRQLSMGILNNLSADDAADAHASNFIHTCMPPKFSKDEADFSIHGNGNKFQAGLIKTVSSLTADTKIRWIRRRAFRLVVNELGVRLVHTLCNSKNSKEEDMEYNDVDEDVIPAISVLFKQHPEFVAIRDLPLDGMDRKLAFAEAMYYNGFLMTEEPLPVVV